MKIIDWCKTATINSFAGTGNGDGGCFPILVKSIGESPPSISFFMGKIFPFPSPNRGISRGESKIGSSLPSLVGSLPPSEDGDMPLRSAPIAFYGRCNDFFCPTLTLDDMMVSVLQGHWPH
jgi:hypothetical protein